MSDRNNTTVLSIAAITCSILAGSYYYSSKSGKKTSKKKDSNDNKNDTDDNVEYIAEEDIVKVFDALFIQMQNVISQLGQQIQQIQMMGQNIPQAQLRQLIKGEFERALLAKQGQIFDEHGMDEDCVQEATMEFLAEPDKYPKAKKAVQRFQMLWENVSGEQVASLTPAKESSAVSTTSAQKETLSKEDLLKSCTIYFDALTDAMRDIVQNLKDGGANLADPMVLNQMQMEFASVANDKGEQELKDKMGVSLDDFRSSIEKYGEDPEVARTLALLQMRQQQDLASLGVAAM